jgi:hypothetical protein
MLEGNGENVPQVGRGGVLVVWEGLDVGPVTPRHGVNEGIDVADVTDSRVHSRYQDGPEDCLVVCGIRSD